MRCNLNILQSIYSFEIGGIETFTINMAQYLTKDNVSNHIIISSKGRDANFCESKKQMIASMGINVFNIYSKHKVIKFINLIKVLKKSKPDIVMVHHEKNAIKFIILKIFFKYKILQVQHNSKINAMLMHKYILKYFISKYIAVSKEVEKTMIKSIKISNRKIIYIHNGVILKQFKSNNKKADSVIRIGIVGRFEEQKNYLELIDIIIDIIKENTTINIKVLFAGDGKQKEEVMQKAMQFKNIIFLGNVTRMKEFYEKIDIFASYSKYEGFSLALIEAIASQCVPIVTETSGVNEIIIDGYNGYIVPQNKKDIYKKYLNKLIKDIDIRKAFIRNNKKVINKYDFSNIYNKYIEVLKNL